MSMARRADAGTAHKLTLGYKLVKDFVPVGNSKAAFLETRMKKFEQLALAQAERHAALQKPINVTLPDGKVMEAIAFKTTPLDIANQISKFLGGSVMISRVQYTNTVQEDVADAEADLSSDDEAVEAVACCGDLANASDDPMAHTTLWDCNRPLEGDCKLFLLKWEHVDAQKTFWHSSAHILGQAMEREFGGHLTNGPALNPGFYYDVYVGDIRFNPEHIARLQKACDAIVKENQSFERVVITKQQALDLFIDNPFKQQLITHKVPDNAKTSVYRCGNFVDLCLGPHVPTTGRVKFFQLTSASSTTFLGDRENDMLQRVYGVAFPEKDLLEQYNTRMAELNRRKHQVMGNEQQLFFFSNDMSPGSAFWLPAGARLYNKLIEFIRKEYRFRGFNEVITPNIFDCKLWKTSGHYEKYADCMFMLDIEGQEWAKKGMNCPGHCLMFKHMNPSYKQLPIRLADFGVLHRNEFSGSLNGLFRVRRFQQDDAHIFCRPDQVTFEVQKALEFLFFVYDLIGFRFQLKLSTRPDNRLGADELWEEAENALEQALINTGKPYGYKHGDGAFYGPKIDIQLFDAMDRLHQCGTIQLDYQLPIRFDLSYKTNENTELTAEEREAAKAAKEAAKAAAKEAAMAAKAAAKARKEAGEAAAPSATAETPVAPVADHNHIERSHGRTHCCGEDDELLRNPNEFVWKETPLKAGFQRPVIIHRAILGSLERMSAVLMEHFACKWPFWCSPRQAVVLPVTDKQADYAQWVADTLKGNGFDCEMDTNLGKKLDYKVRLAQEMKWNYMLIVGDKEKENMTVTLRDRDDDKLQMTLSIPEVIAKFSELCKVNSQSFDEFKPFVQQAYAEGDKKKAAAAAAQE